MILSDFVVPSRSNQRWQTTGIDSLESCIDRQHFRLFPHRVEYVYNCRGYRDNEWPESLSELQKSIWCIGDSFTVGLGSPLEHTWTYLIQKFTDRRSINVSLDGGSNNWMARKAIRVLNEISPEYLIIHWSYVSRRELGVEAALNKKWNTFYNNVKDSSWPNCDRSQAHKLPTEIINEIKLKHKGWRNEIFDDERVIPHVRCNTEDDVKNTLDCIQQVEQNKGLSKIIHSFIPKFVPRSHKGIVENQIEGLVIPEITCLDLARDGHHYDIKTSHSLVTKILQLL